MAMDKPVYVYTANGWVKQKYIYVRKNGVWTEVPIPNVALAIHERNDGVWKDKT